MKLTESQKQKIRESARGEDCTANIFAVCNYNPETVVWAHFHEETKGMGIKGFDLSGGYACSNCHDIIDGREKLPKEFWPGRERFDKEFYMRRSQTRTLKRLIEKGILIIK